MEERICPECKSVRIHPDLNGDDVCQDCGLVIGEKMLDNTFNSLENKGAFRKTNFNKDSNYLKIVSRLKKNKHEDNIKDVEVTIKDIKKLLENYCSALNLSKIFEDNCWIIIEKMYYHRHLNGDDYEILILAVIYHFLFLKNLDESLNLQNSLKFAEEKLKSTIEMGEQAQKYPQKIEFFCQNLYEDFNDIKMSLDNVGLDGRFYSVSQKRMRNLLELFPEMESAIINRLKDYIHPRNLLPLPHKLSLSLVMFLDKRFAKAFENEEELLNLLKNKDGTINKERILELRNDSINYALVFLCAMKPFENKKLPKGLFRSCLYYLIKHYFKEEFRDVSFIQGDFIKFFHIKRENLFDYLKIFKEKPLDSRTFKLMNLLD